MDDGDCDNWTGGGARSPHPPPSTLDWIRWSCAQIDKAFAWAGASRTNTQKQPIIIPSSTYTLRPVCWVRPPIYLLSCPCITHAHSTAPFPIEAAEHHQPPAKADHRHHFSFSCRPSTSSSSSHVCAGMDVADDGKTIFFFARCSPACNQLKQSHLNGFGGRKANMIKNHQQER